MDEFIEDFEITTNIKLSTEQKIFSEPLWACSMESALIGQFDALHLINQKFLTQI